MGGSRLARAMAVLAELPLCWHNEAVVPEPLTALLKLPPSERADLAMALWESLDESQREAEFSLTPALAEELDRRLAEHLADPGSAIPWAEVRREISRSS